MSRELAKWMRTAGIAITNEIVNLREEGIDNFLKRKMQKKLQSFILRENVMKIFLNL